MWLLQPFLAPLMTKNLDGLLKGQVGQWQNQPTCTVRIPQKFKKPLLEFVKGLDVDNAIAPLHLLPLKELLRIQSEIAELIDRKKRQIRNRIVTENLNLARKVAHRIANHPHCPFTYEDLEQQAFLALTLASDRFEPERGNKFSTFATPIIRGRLLHYIRDKGTGIKVPRAFYELYFKAIKYERKLGSLEAVAEHLKISLETLEEAYHSVESCHQSSGIAEGADWRSPPKANSLPSLSVKWDVLNPEQAAQIKTWLGGGRISPTRLRDLLLNVPLDTAHS